MLQAGSGSRFSYNDYNYDNDNSNVSAHIATKILSGTNHAPWQKITNNLNGVGSYPANTTYKAKAMKRIGNIYEKMCSIDSILLADQIARKGKSRQSGVINFDKKHDQNIADLYRELVTNTYKTSPYRTRIINEGKERKISILPYRDRVMQHNAMIYLEPVFVSTFTADTVIALMPWFTISDSDVRLRYLYSYGLKSITALPRKTFAYVRIQTVIIHLERGFIGTTEFKVFDFIPKIPCEESKIQQSLFNMTI